MANDNRMKFEAEFDFDTKTATQKVQKLLSTLNEMAQTEAQGNVEVEKLQRGLKSAAKSATEAFGKQGLGRFQTNILNIKRWNKALEETKQQIAELKPQIKELESPRNKTADKRAEDLEKAAELQTTLNTLTDKERDIKQKIKVANQENMALSQRAENLIKEYDTAFNKAIDIRAIKLKESVEKSATLTAEEKKGVDIQKDAAKAAQDTADATEKIVGAQKKLNEETGKTTSKRKESTTFSAGEDATENVKNKKRSSDRVNAILENVKAIAILEKAGADASVQIAALEGKLNALDLKSAKAADLDSYIRDIQGAIGYIIKDLGSADQLPNIFNMLTAAVEPAKQALGEIKSEFRDTQGEEEQNFSIAKLVEKYNQLYLLVEKGQSTPADWEQLQETKKLLNEITSLNFKDPDALPAELSLMIKELQEGFVKIRDLIKSGNFSDKTKELSASLFNALEQAKIAYADMKKEAKEPLPADKLKEFHTAMQGVLDITDKVSQKMRFDTNTVSIAELIRRLKELNQAKKTLEDFGLPREMDHRYTQLIQMIAQTNAQLSEEKKKVQEVAEASIKAGNDGSTAQAKIKSSASKTVSPLKRLGNEVKVLKSGFSSLSRTADKVKSSFDSMARNMRSNFKHMITSITKYVLGFRSLFFLVRRLRKYLGEGIKNLAQFENGANPVNEAITDMLSSLLYLKNAWAAAFAPIITTVRPMLVSLIDNLAAVGNTIARFLGALLGVEVTFNAVRISAEDYAGGLDDVGGSAGGAADKVKKLTDRLAAFDDLNVLGKDNDNDGTGSGGGGGSADAYTPDPNEMFKIVNGETNQFLEALKNAWLNADFTEVGSIIKDKLIEILTIDWDEIKGKVNSFSTNLGDFLNGLFGDPELWKKAGEDIAEAFNTITGGISSFLDEIEDTPFGENAGTGVNEFLRTTDWETAGDNINRTITGISDNIKDFADTLNADDIASSIEDFLTGLDIPEIAASVGKLVISAGELIVKVIWATIEGGSSSFAQSLIDYVNSDFNVAYLTKDGIRADITFGIDTDWTEHPIQALFERIAMGLGGKIIDNEIKILIGFGLADDEGDAFNKILGAWDTFKQNWDEFWSGFKKGWTDFWDGFFGFFDFGSHFEDIAENSDIEDWWDHPVAALIEGLAKGITEAIGLEQVSEWFAGVIEGFCDLFDIHSPSGVAEEWGENIVEGLKNGIENLIDTVMEPFTKLKDDLLAKWEEVKTDAQDKWGLIKSTVTEKAEEIKESATEKFDTLKTNLVEKWQEIKGSIYEKLVGIKSNAIEVFEQLKEKVKDPINGFIDIVETMVNKVIDGINWLAEEFNSLPDVQFSWMGQNYELGFNIPTLGHVTIPHLAQGAVIPPNKEFMAVLGDQSHGTNIEAPLDTIKQAVAEVLANNNNQEVIDLLQQLIRVVESKNLTIGDKEIGKANARFTNQQRMIRGTTF